MINYEVLDKQINGFAVIRISEGEFQGVQYTYGALSIEEDTVNDVAKLKFEYDIIEGSVNDVSGFESLIAVILHDTLDTQVETETVIYHGGTNDSVES